jgi:LysR family glycine cleavage system transcriptional activator
VLEDRLGVVLLERERLGMRLTEAGASVYPRLREAFLQIDQAMHALERSKGERSLTVSTVATFAASWLVPRLGRFKQLHPDIEIRVEATSELVDLRRDRVDVASPWAGRLSGLEVTCLMAPVLTPVASPEFLKTCQGAVINEAGDCLDYPLLHDRDRADWPLWLKAHGVADDARAQRGSAFEDDFLLIRAAEAGQGLALVPQAYAQEEIATGRLIQVLDKPWPARFAYYAVTALVRLTAPKCAPSWTGFAQKRPSKAASGEPCCTAPCRLLELNHPPHEEQAAQHYDKAKQRRIKRVVFAAPKQYRAMQ